MISVSEAKMIIHNSVEALLPVEMLLNRASGLTLAEDVIALFDIPAFPQSSLDGYAFSFDGWNQKNPLNIEGEMAAGDNKSLMLGSNKAIRIFTGAPVPPGADTVVMQEKVSTENNQLFIEDEKLRPGSNVRPQGSEIKADETALITDSYLSAAAIGFLAGIGIGKVKVYPSPRVTIIVTGNELQQYGEPLAYGKVYESNSIMLTIALQRMNIWDVEVKQVQDDEQLLTNVFHEVLDISNVVLFVGGISVGDYDFVLKAVTDSGVSTMFHKIKQRPGKPLYYGKMGKKLIFGLPGNPSSSLVCFFIYVMPALQRMMKTPCVSKAVYATLDSTYKKEPGLTHFLKGFYDGQSALPLNAQESYRLRSFAQSNCLIQIDEEVGECVQGTDVQIHLMPF